MCFLPAWSVVRVRLTSLASSFLLASTAFFFAALPAHAQNPAVGLASAGTVRNLSDLGGSGSAVSGHFSSGKYLDFIIVGMDHTTPTGDTFDDLVHNNQNGTFAVSSLGSADQAPNLAADFDGDGLTDTLIYFSGTGFQIAFSNPSIGGQVYPTDSPVSFAAAGDFNNDGRMDIALITASAKLAIFLNDGSGKFHQASSSALPKATNIGASLAVGDLNNDGRPDILVLYSGSASTVTPYISHNNGTFTKGVTTSVGATVSSNAVIGDFNKDGYGDAAIVTSSGVKIMLGSSTGAFHAGTTLASPGAGCSPNGGANNPEISCLVVADLNKDGKLDLAVSGTVPYPFGNPIAFSAAGPGYVSVYLGNGTGGFSGPTVYGSMQSPASLFAGDVFNTGHIDLTTFTGDGSLNFLRGDGTGRFHASPNTLSSNATGIVAGDFNRDGKQDLAVVNTPRCTAPCKGAITVFTGSGSNFFNAGKQYAIGMHGAAIATGDLNKDGVLDLVVSNTAPGDGADVSVLLGNKDGTFQAAHSFTLGSLSNEAILMDMNKDGKLDLVLDNGVALGKGDGTFGSLIRFPATAPGIQPHIAVGDFNGDGKLDVVLANSDDQCTNDVQILLGKGDGHFTLGQDMFAQVGEPIYSIAVGQLRNGKPLDIAYAFAGGCGAQSDQNFFSGVTTLAGKGDGTFTAGLGAIRGDNFHLIVAGPVVIADFNHDGKMDIGAGAFDGRFLVATGKGDGTLFNPVTFTASNDLQPFSPPAQSGTFTVFNGVAAADFTGDGRPDVLLTNAQGIARLYNAAVPTVSPGALSFTQPGTSQTVTVKNTLTIAQTFGASIRSSLAANFKVTSNSCHGSIASGASCKVTVVYSPSQSNPNLPTALIITDNLSEVADIPLGPA